MKGSFVLVIGGIVFVGISAFIIYKRVLVSENSKKQNDKVLKYEEEPVNTDFIREKENMANTIKKRHNEAAQEIKRSLETIYNENKVEEKQTENSELLHNIEKDLDDLLK